MSAKQLAFKPGDEVTVPWGLGTVIGVVVEVYGPRNARSVLVEVPVSGASGEVLERETVSIPASALQLVA